MLEIAHNKLKFWG